MPINGNQVRTIFHVDMDAFFVSVEELFNPDLIGKPVIVGGGPDQRGVVSAASYAARKFGVHSALPLRTAARLCPHAIFVEGTPGRYREYSGKVFEVLNRFSPKVEMASIDEAYLDLTGTARLLGPPLKAAQSLHHEVKRSTGLNCSIGIGTTRLIAKIASDQAKPNGMLWIPPGVEQPFLAPLHIRKIPGVGAKTEARLRQYGITHIGHLTKLDDTFLSELMGKWGLALAGKSRGLDAGGYFEGAVAEENDPRSISHEHTFGTDLRDPELLEATLARLSQMVGRRLREQQLHARTLQIKLRYSDFSTFTRAHTLDHATQLDIDLIEHSRLLFRRNWTGQTIRLLGVQTSGLTNTEGQLDLLEEEKSRKWRHALTAVDKLRDRFGEKTVSVASGMKGQYADRVHENPAGLPGKRKGPSVPKNTEAASGAPIGPDRGPNNEA
ncbi:MAG: DNA polymerase IV [Bryobacteraceae bacterium]|nr:DNA polymerase IV [Bryobacteraceae bacterium]